MSSFVVKKKLRYGEKCLDQSIYHGQIKTAVGIAVQIKEQHTRNINRQAVILNDELVLFGAKLPVDTVELVACVVFAEVKYLGGIITGAVLREEIALLVHAVAVMNDTADIVPLRHYSYLCMDIPSCYELEYSKRVIYVEIQCSYFNAAAEF